MKKICHMSVVHRAHDTRIFRKQCVSLAKAGYDTHLVVVATASEIAEAAAHDVTIHPLDHGHRRSRLSRMLFGAWRCYRVAKEIDADLYHFHDPELIPYGLLLARSGKKVIFDAHEELPAQIQTKTWIPSRVRRPVAALSCSLENFCARRISAVIAATPHIATQFDGVARRVVIINNYPLLDELNPPKDIGKEKRDSVCYVGGIDVIRGIREIVKAIGAAGTKLRLAGSFTTDVLRNELKQYPGWANVREYGFVDRQGVSEIMSQSFSGLVTLHRFSSFVNSQPIKMFEYMSAGLPVIASDFPLWREIVEGNQCGICVDQDDPEKIAAAIRHLRDHPEEVTRMGNNGRRAVAEKYRWDHEEAKLLSLYRSLLGT